MLEKNTYHTKQYNINSFKCLDWSTFWIKERSFYIAYFILCLLLNVEYLFITSWVLILINIILINLIIILERLILNQYYISR